MAITPKSIKILWTSAAGRCAFPGCWERLCKHDAEGASPYTLGEMAHICGERLGANRHDPSQTEGERNHYHNLILLCPTHHTLVDRKENEAEFTVEALHTMKAAHEAKVLERLDKDDALTKREIARAILPLLEENRQSWVQYGPLSELARTEPHNELAHAVWMSERLSVIVPNNRKIKGILVEHREKFEPENLLEVVAFLTHARSYERWVEDEIPYSAVRRFPIAFDGLIRRIANAGT